MDRDAIEFKVDEGEGPVTVRISEPPPTVRVVAVSADDVDLSMGDALDEGDDEGEEVAPGDVLDLFEATR
ncbi:MAG: hypothetical protein MUF34_20055 [Polyangiaceae bacterium]|jgi:hypothetical protein|nr:hypothetical protein [Polyangiaceae bacterium]